MDIESLQVFIEVARRGSFAAVARDRDLDPSSVSRIISALEDELGLRLFQRTTRRMALTEAGAIYVNRIEQVIEDLAQAREAALALNSGPIGLLRLTTSVAFGLRYLVPLLPQFRVRYPDLKVELLLTDTNLDLVSDRIDLAIRLGPRIKADVIRVKLFDTLYRVCASPSYLNQAAPLEAPPDLEAHRCLLFPLPGFRSQWMFRDGAGKITTIQVDGDILISNALALRDCALAGLGPALLANWLVDSDLKAGRLIQLFPTYTVTATEFETSAWLLYPSQTFLPHKVSVMVDFLKQQRPLSDV